MTSERPAGVADGAERSQANDAQLPETFESLILQGVTDRMAAGSPAETAEEDEDTRPEGEQLPDSEEEPGELVDDRGEPASDEDDKGTPDQEEAGSDKPQKPAGRTAAEWAQLLATDGPQRIAEVPAAISRSPEFLRAYGEATARSAAQAAQTVLAENMRQERNLRRFVAEVDTRFEDDPDAKVDWLETDPQGQLYLQAKQYLATLEGMNEEQRVQAAQAEGSLNARAQRQYNRLNKYPEAQAELIRRQQGQRYSATVQGVELLEADVDELLEQHARQQNAPAATPTGPDTQQGEPRRPRPARSLVSGGDTPPPAPRDSRDITKVNNPDDLFGMGVAEAIAGARRGRRG